MTCSDTDLPKGYKYNSSKATLIKQAIEEIYLLEDLIDTSNYNKEFYNKYREEICKNCSLRCLRSEVDIVHCTKERR